MRHLCLSRPILGTLLSVVFLSSCGTREGTPEELVADADTLIVGEPKISHAQWKVHYADSEQAPLFAAASAIDGNPQTFWHTQYVGSNPAPPHEIQVDLGAEYDVRGFSYLPRQDGGGNGRIGQYEFYVSADAASWGSATAAGAFANSPLEQQVACTAKRGRFVRLVAKTEASGKPWTSIAELDVMGIRTGPQPRISNTNWKLRYVDSEQGPDFGALLAFDGNPQTMWHTQYVGANPFPPHEIQIDLGAEYDIRGFAYLPRQDSGINGNIVKYEFYASTDGSSWGSPMVSGDFASTSAEKEVSAAAKRGRFVRLRALSEINGKPWTSVAELSVMGTPTGGTVGGPIRVHPTNKHYFLYKDQPRSLIGVYTHVSFSEGFWSYGHWDFIQWKAFIDSLAAKKINVTRMWINWKGIGRAHV